MAQKDLSGCIILFAMTFLFFLFTTYSVEQIFHLLSSSVISGVNILFSKRLLRLYKSLCCGARFLWRMCKIGPRMTVGPVHLCMSCYNVYCGVIDKKWYYRTPCMSRPSVSMFHIWVSQNLEHSFCCIAWFMNLSHTKIMLFKMVVSKFWNYSMNMFLIFFFFTL